MHITLHSQTCLFWTPWDPINHPDYRGVLISQVHLYTYILQWDHVFTIIEVCPYYRGVLISQVHLYTFILQWDHVFTIIEVCPYYRGVLIIEVSLFQSVHNSRLDFICTLQKLHK